MTQALKGFGEAGHAMGFRKIHHFWCDEYRVLTHQLSPLIAVEELPAPSLGSSRRGSCRCWVIDEANAVLHLARSARAEDGLLLRKTQVTKPLRLAQEEALCQELLLKPPHL